MQIYASDNISYWYRMNYMQIGEWLSFTAFSDSGQRDPYNPYKLYDHNLYIGLIIYPHVIKKETPIKLTCHWGQ